MSKEEKIEQYEGETSGQDQQTPETGAGPETDEAGGVTASQPEPQSSQPPAKVSSKSGVFLAFLALIVAIGGIVGGYQLWQKNLAVVGQLDSQTGQIAGQVETRFKETDQRMAQIEGKVSQLAQATSSLEPKIASVQASLQSELKALDSRLNDKITGDFNILQQSLASLQEKLNEVKPEEPVWEPEEVEYLIRIAIDSLQFKRDVGTAVAALTAADNRLREIGHPAFANTRRMIADDLNALLAVPKADIAGAAFTLSSLQDAVTKLPLPSSNSTPAAEEGATQEEEVKEEGWKGFFLGMWQAFKDLVTVRHREQSEQPILPPEEHEYLVQNLQLKMETARLALLRRDEQIYHDSLKAIKDWINKYYDTNDAAVSGALASLDKLDQMVVNPELPSLTASLNAIREVIASQAFATAASPQSNNNGGE
ncbi:MAG TPA: hypothetical protein ENJ22_05060 [Gammaproteobacteria bacterium]|nr:hypothetical protein [Gammaproteobacteria bacterium]